MSRTVEKVRKKAKLVGKELESSAAREAVGDMARYWGCLADSKDVSRSIELEFEELADAAPEGQGGDSELRPSSAEVGGPACACQSAQKG